MDKKYKKDADQATLRISARGGVCFIPKHNKQKKIKKKARGLTAPANFSFSYLSIYHLPFPESFSVGPSSKRLTSHSH